MIGGGGIAFRTEFAQRIVEGQLALDRQVLALFRCSYTSLFDLIIRRPVSVT